MCCAMLSENNLFPTLLRHIKISSTLQQNWTGMLSMSVECLSWLFPHFDPRSFHFMEPRVGGDDMIGATSVANQCRHTFTHLSLKSFRCDALAMVNCLFDADTTKAYMPFGIGAMDAKLCQNKFQRHPNIIVSIFLNQTHSILFKVYCWSTVSDMCHVFLICVKPSQLPGRSSQTAVAAHLKCPPGCRSLESRPLRAGASQNSQKPGGGEKILKGKGKINTSTKIHAVVMGPRTFLYPSHFRSSPTLRL